MTNKTILITGGAGCFGQKFAEVALKHNPKVIRIYDNREYAEVEMERRLKDKRLRFFIGDVRDKNRLGLAMKEADIVIHAAALKHVPICEYNPTEAIRTNIEGTMNVIDTAIKNGVEKVIMISTDKAVYPVNLYGATKMVSEKLFIQGNIGSKTIFSCCRYGNVIGSRGSVIPLFKEQKVITITDEKMTRFWITLERGIQFVIDCLKRMKGGEIFIPKMPSMRITDLANAIAPDKKRNIIGIRPGEKLDEILITKEEIRHTKEFDNYFIIEPEFPFWPHREEDGKKPLKEYKSDTNDNWIKSFES